MTFPPKVWDGVLRRLGEDIPAFAVEAWLRPLVPVSADDPPSDADPRVGLQCPTSFHREHIRSHFLAQLGEGLAREFGHPVRLELELSPVSRAPSTAGKTPSSAHDAASSATAAGDGAPLSRTRTPRTVRAPRGANAKPGPRSIADALGPIESSLRQQQAVRRTDGGLSEPGVQPRGRPGGDPRRPAQAAPDATAERHRDDAQPEPGVARETRQPRPSLAVPQPPAPHRSGSQQPKRGTALQYRFENFVVGPCNQLGRAAALSLARAESDSLSHLYLAAGPGLGKTHLARAVASESARSGARVRYCSAESFTNDFTAAVSSHEMTGFKRRYRRECNVLIIEDVGFFDSKAKTQLEFFHTVQHVLDAGGRVVLTGSSLPRDLRGLDEPVRALLAGGFVAELEAPDEGVRREILRAKAAAGGVRLPPQCLDLLIGEVAGSIRELEGVLIQLVTTASLLGQAIDLELTRQAVEKKRGPSRDRGRPRPQPELVIRTVSSFFKTTPEALASRSRRRDVLVPRQLAMYLCRRYTDASLGEIGRALGRDHPSVKNAVERVERQVLERAPVRYQIEALCERLDALLRGERD